MAWIPPAFLNSTVALGVQSQDQGIQYTGTAFMYGYPTGTSDVNGLPTHWPFLVTNRHVFTKARDRRTVLHARFNRPVDVASPIYSLPLDEPDGPAFWTVHQEADVAVLPLNSDHLRTEGIEFFFFSPDHAFTVDQARAVDMSEGDGVFVLGFPLGEAGDERNYAIVRQGIIARVRDWMSGKVDTFLIDASIFPGNSGGPVLLKPELTSVGGTKRNDRCGLIGMVASYLPYQEIAVSTQTDRPRMIFEENSGLGVVVPFDVIHETVEAAVSKFRSTGEAASPSVEHSQERGHTCGASSGE